MANGKVDLGNRTGFTRDEAGFQAFKEFLDQTQALADQFPKIDIPGFEDFAKFNTRNLPDDEQRFLFFTFTAEGAPRQQISSSLGSIEPGNTEVIDQIQRGIDEQRASLVVFRKQKTSTPGPIEDVILETQQQIPPTTVPIEGTSTDIDNRNIRSEILTESGRPDLAADALDQIEFALGRDILPSEFDSLRASIKEGVEQGLTPREIADQFSGNVLQREERQTIEESTGRIEDLFNQEENFLQRGRTLESIFTGQGGLSTPQDLARLDQLVFSDIPIEDAILQTRELASQSIQRQETFQEEERQRRFGQAEELGVFGREQISSALEASCPLRTRLAWLSCRTDL